MIPVEPIPDGTILAPHHFITGAVVALWAFVFVWRVYPRLGSALALAGLLVALDDWISHALGWWTPLDAGWTVVYRMVVA